MSAVTQEGLWADLKTLSRAALTKKYGSVMAALSHGLRGTIVAPSGKTLYVADFASIEARVLLWCAGDERGLDIFRNHEDPYCDMASDLFGYPTNKQDHPKERGLGKIAILGLGYQMGPAKFVDSCALAGITIPEDSYCETCGGASKTHRKENHPFDSETEGLTAVQVVNAYRTKYWRNVQLWADQEAAAIAAVVSRQPVQAGKVQWVYHAPFLYCVLPSGRQLAYNEPRVKSTLMPWGKMRDVLSYMGIDGYTHQWRRQPTYGGMLVENIVQAISRDALAEAMTRCEAAAYPVVLSVHDETICEVPVERKPSLEEFIGLMTERPDWARGLPIEVDAWCGQRYRK